MAVVEPGKDKPPSNKARLLALVGATCCALLFNFVPKHEGEVLRGYRDPIGIATKCFGDTNDVVVGKAYTKAECQASLEIQLIEHGEDVLKCTPILRGHPYQLAAAISFAYNIGGAKYCASTTAKRFNRGDFKGACRAINQSDSGKPQWVYGLKNGKLIKLNGLVKRRAEERALCEKDL